MRNRLLIFWVCLAGLALAEPTQIPVNETYQLPAVIDLPAAPPRAVVVLVHGSGAHSKDEELGAVTEGKVPNPFFARLSQALTDQGLAVLRYDKRNYTRPDKENPAYKELVEHPAESYISDCRSAMSVARQRFPGLPLLLLGHSEGTWVTLQAARLDGKVDGLVEIGYMAGPLTSLVLEQVVYRPMLWFEQHDLNHDGVLLPTELTAEVKLQMPVIDLDHDGNLSKMEFQAGNWSNVLIRPIIPDSWRRGEATYPDPNLVVSEATCPILFLQGEWDNQTPCYAVKALQLVENEVWKKGNKRFCYFAQAGHALDPRKSPDDIVFRLTPPATLQECARQIVDFCLPRL